MRAKAMKLAFIFSFIALLACNRPPPPPPPRPPQGPIAAVRTGNLELGTGREAFVAIQDGESLQKVPGAQGCCHLWISLRAKDIQPELVRIRVGYYRATDGTELQVNEYRITLVPQSGQFEITGLVGFLPDVPDETLDLRLELTDSKNRTLTDYRRIRLLPAP